MNIDLRPEEHAGDVFKLSFGLEFNRNHRNVVVGKAMFIEDLLCALGVIHDDPDDGGVGCIHEAKRHNVDVGT